MTFDEWAENIGLIAQTYDEPPVDDKVRRAWRCQGPCGQLMYGIERRRGKNYPSGDIPVGLALSAEYQRVCSLCWDMYHVLDERRYWKNLSVTDKNSHGKLRPGGNYFAT